MKKIRLPNGKVIILETDDDEATEALRQLQEQQRIHEEHVGNMSPPPSFPSES
jgi:hypothetical protein